MEVRNILPSAFSIMADRRKVNTDKAKGNIFMHWPTNSVSKTFIDLLMNINNFIEKNRPCTTKLTS